MKAKTKRDLKVSESFLREFQISLPAEFEHFVKLLHDYGDGLVDKEQLYDYLRDSFRKVPDLISKFNTFLNTERKLLFIHPEKIKMMLDFVFKELSMCFAENDQKLWAFIDSFIILSKERIDNVRFTSSKEMVEHTSREIVQSERIQALGEDFIKLIINIMNSYKERVVSETEERIEYNNPIFIGLPDAASAGQSSSKPDRPEPSKKSKSRLVSESVEPRVAEPLKSVQVEPLIESEPIAENPQVENLKIEDNVFKALRRRLAPGDFSQLIKLIHLLQRNVISYFELIRVAEPILLKLEKSVCLSLRELLESRERSRQSSNIFNVKNHLLTLEGAHENRSYKLIDCEDLFREGGDGSLVNKMYVTTAHGNEASYNVDDKIDKKHMKNASEELLFKVEDEAHEIDSTIQQLRMALRWIGELVVLGPDDLKAQRLHHKLSLLKPFQLIYGKFSQSVIRELSGCKADYAEVVQLRVREKLQMLERLRKDVTKKHWMLALDSNFYKALDSRVNNIKAMEKRFFNNRGFLLNARDVAEDEMVPLGDSVSELVFGQLARSVYLPAPPSQDPHFWNPVVCFDISNKTVLSDVLFFIKAFVRLSKTNNSEKERTIAFTELFVRNFLSVDPQQSHVSSDFKSPAEINSYVKRLEHEFFPNKEFFFSDKLVINFDNSALPALEDFLKQRLETAEPAPAIRPTADLSRTPVKEPAQEESEDRDGEDSHPSGEPPGNAMQIESEQSGAPDSRSFYASYQYYMIYQDVVLIYERLNFVYRNSQERTNSSTLYETFKQLLAMHIFGVLDVSNYENIVRILFDTHSGVFLTFDKILYNFMKHVTNDDFFNFVTRLNSPVFENPPESQSLPESVLFGRTCAKVTALIAQNNKNFKSSAFNIGPSSSGALEAELLKFDFYPASACFAIHRIRFTIPSDCKSESASQSQFIKTHYKLFSIPSHVRSRDSLQKAFLENNVTISFDISRTALLPVKSGAEDQLFNFRKENALASRKKKICKLSKIKRFHEFLASRIAA